jgi:hypothetical protein
MVIADRLCSTFMLHHHSALEPTSHSSINPEY